MAWNGSGTFVRVHNWVSDRDSAINITASRMDAEDDGFAAGLTACLTKNGENTATANLPMGGFRHTGVGDATARNQYGTVGKLQDSGHTYAADSGAADAYVIAPSPAITAYAAGQQFIMNAANTNTGASTVNVNGLGAKSIVNANNEALSRNEIVSGRTYILTYDGTAFQLTSPKVSAKKNIVLNGDFQVWPEGTSFTGVANADHSAAQWLWEQSGAGVADVAQITTALPTVAEAGRLITSAIQVDVTTANATLAAGDHCTLRTRIEGYAYAQIAQRPMVLSFWHKHTKTGAYCVSLRNTGNDRSYIAEYTQSVSDTWERAEIPITASPSAGTWDYTTGIGLRLDFTIASGTNLHTTADAWQTGNFRSTSSQVNGMDAATNFFRIAGVQLEAGSVATEFEQDRYEDVLAATKRYYQLLPGTGINGYAASTSRARVSFLHEAEMRVAPTVTLVDTTPNLLYRGTSQNGVSSTIANSTISSQGARLEIDGFTGLTIGEGTMFNQLNILFEIDARL